MQITNPEDELNDSEQSEDAVDQETVDFAEAETIEKIPEDLEENDLDDDTDADTDDDVDSELEDDEPVDMVEQLSLQLTESQDRYLRLRAEMDNLRKRSTRDKEDARQYAKISAIDEILPVMDQFQMAVAAMESNHDPETIKQGMSMILNTFNSCFDSLGIKTVHTSGKFDPMLHEAVSSEASEDIEVDHIIRVWKSGYMLGEKLIRPATVVISSGSPEDDTSETEEAIEDDAEDINEINPNEPGDSVHDEIEIPINASEETAEEQELEEETD